MEVDSQFPLSASPNACVIKTRTVLGDKGNRESNWVSKNFNLNLILTCNIIHPVFIILTLTCAGESELSSCTKVSMFQSNRPENKNVSS